MRSYSHFPLTSYPFVIIWNLSIFSLGEERINHIYESKNEVSILDGKKEKFIDPVWTLVIIYVVLGTILKFPEPQFPHL